MEETMIDFTNAIEEFNNYKGSEKKKTLVYNDKKYLVKFPDPIREKNKNISYINNAFSEYIGSNIFKICGFKTQNTVLGKYIYNGKEKIVCACEDFTHEENILYEFENLALSTNPDKKIETELRDIMDVIEESKMIDSEKTKEIFWNMFIIRKITTLLSSPRLRALPVSAAPSRVRTALLLFCSMTASRWMTLCRSARG